MKLKNKYAILGLVSTSVLFLDQLTKIWVIRNFDLGETVSVIPGIFNFTYVRNTGAAFGILADANPAFRVPFFLIVPFVALFVIAYLFKKIPPGEKWVPLALALVSGGAIGNLIDRIVHGYVIDFLDFHWKYQHHFPAFNVADSAICVGIGILMLDLVVLNPEGTQSAPSTR